MGSLRRQSLLVISAILIVFLAIGSTITYFVMERSMREFENRDALQTQKRINILLNQQMFNMAKQTADYAVWTATYAFMEKFDENYIVENYSQEIFDNLDIDQVYLVRPDNSFAMAMIRANQLTPGATGIKHIVNPKPMALASHILSEVASSRASKIGSFLSFNGQKYIYGVSEVLTSDREGPARGKMLFIRLLNQKRLNALKQLAIQDFSLDAKLLKDQIRVDDERIQSTKTLFNTIGKPIATVHVNQARPLKSLVGTTRQILNINALILTIIALFFVYIMFDRIVLRKIDLLVRNIFSIRQAGAIGKLIPVIGDQDIDRISSEVNCMLEDLSYSHRKLEHEVFHDNMTGLGNRKLLLQELEIASERLVTGKIDRFALMLMDLDAFKDINDIHGHLAGDHVISMVANRLSACKIRTNLPVRLGGDEFAMIYQNYPLPSPEAYAQSILDAVSQPIEWEGYSLNVQASIGILAVDSKSEAKLKPTDLLRKADIAMYASKNKSQNGFRLFHADIEKKLSDRIRLESELSLMITNKTFEIWMQPILDSKTGKLFSLEVLSRWFHPQLGTIPPITFIALAESTKEIARFDRAVIGKASAALSQLRKNYPELKICINISATTLIEDDICEYISSTLNQHALPKNVLLLEITETMLATDKSRLETNINCLRATGVQFLIDDFGTGYSSLSRLSDLSLDYVKIDKEFLKSINISDNQICNTIIKLAHSLDMLVIAEGVETDIQHQRLINLGCNYVQGFKFAKPMNEALLAKYLAALSKKMLVKRVD